MRKPYYISCLRRLNHHMDSLQHDFACGQKNEYDLQKKIEDDPKKNEEDISM